MAVQQETELYYPLKKFFENQGYEIKSEVKHCDLVGMRPGDEETLIVEIKRTFNLALLLQGIERQRLSGQVYLAVERNRAKKGAHNQRWGELTMLCRRLGLGLITITLFKTKAPYIDVLCRPEEAEPGYAPRTIKKRANRVIHEFRERSGDYNVGGSTGRKLVTAYREKALLVAEAIARSNDISGMAPRMIKELTGVGNTAAILQHNYYRWFRRISYGRYTLTEEGMGALKKYAELLNNRRKPTSSSEAETVNEVPSIT